MKYIKGLHQRVTQPWHGQNMYCLNLRQWVIMWSIIIFINTAVLTTLAVLGYMHSDSVVKLLNDEIQEEVRENGYRADYETEIHANENALYLNLHFVKLSAKIMAICMTLSWINLLFSGLSIYGIVTKTPTLILLWLFVSASTYVAFLIAEMLAFCGAIPELQISYKVLYVTLATGVVFGWKWYVIMRYYMLLKGYIGTPRTLSTVYLADGGYRHTVTPIQQNLCRV